MRLRSITLTDVRQFTRPVRVAGIGDGLNVLSAPNETGKSTLLEAIHAVFFLRHSSKKLGDLRPDVGGNPEITLELEQNGAQLRLHKRWGRGAMAEVWRDGALIARADEAEALIAGLTTAPEDGGPSGLLWVRQGFSELDEGDKATLKGAQVARRDLMSSVTGEFDALTGGRRMDRALSLAQAEMDALMTQRGPKAGGVLEAAVRRVADLAQREADLDARASRLHTALDQRRARRRDLSELADPVEVAARHSALLAAKTALDAAERHAGTLETAAEALKSARIERDALRREIAARDDLTAQLAALAQALTRAGAADAAAQHHAGAARDALRACEARQTTARDARREAEAALQTALRLAALQAQRARHTQLSAALIEAEALALGLGALRQAAANGPDAAALQTLDDAAREAAIAEGLAQQAAPRLALHHQPADAPPVMLDGAPLGPDPRPLTQAATLDLPGIGALHLTPGAAGDDLRLQRARAALHRALDKAGVATPAAARAAALARAEAQRCLTEAQAALRRLAPEGLDALRAEVGRLSAGPDTPPVDPAEAQARVDALRGDEALAEADTARARVADASAREAALAAHLTAQGLTQRLSEGQDALAALRDPALLAQALVDVEAAHQAHTARHAALLAAAPDLPACRALHERARSASERAISDINELRVTLSGLDASIDSLSGDGIDEDLTDTRLKLGAARADEAALRHEVEVLRRLILALTQARDAARDRYFAPLLAELRPLLRLLWPDAELRFDGENLLPSELVRAGRAEAIGTLSGGTREQIALLVRLAFARLLAKSGRHVPVILDDALVFSDDDRIEAMFTALHAQAADLQILVLSCRNRALRPLGGRKLAFETLT